MIRIEPATFYYRLTKETYFLKYQDKINEVLQGKTKEELMIYLWTIFPKYHKKPAKNWINRKVTSVKIKPLLKYAFFYFENTKDIDEQLTIWNYHAQNKDYFRRKIEGLALNKTLPFIFPHDFRYLSFVMVLYQHGIPLTLRKLIKETLTYMKMHRIKEKLIEPQLLLKIPKVEKRDRANSKVLETILMEV